RCAITGNSAGTGGGGIFTNSPLTVTDSTIAGNQSTDGGGMWLVGQNTSTIRNSTISGNSASYGGGIEIISDPLTIENTTVAFNTATYSGGGIRCGGGAVTMTSTVVGNNASPLGPDFYGTYTGKYSLLSNSAEATPYGGSNNLLDVDPLLLPLANNGGPT